MDPPCAPPDFVMFYIRALLVHAKNFLPAPVLPENYQAPEAIECVGRGRAAKAKVWLISKGMAKTDGSTVSLAKHSTVLQLVRELGINADGHEHGEADKNKAKRKRGREAEVEALSASVKRLTQDNMELRRKASEQEQRIGEMGREIAALRRANAKTTREMGEALAALSRNLAGGSPPSVFGST